MIYNYIFYSQFILNNYMIYLNNFHVKIIRYILFTIYFRVINAKCNKMYLELDIKLKKVNVKI